MNRNTKSNTKRSKITIQREIKDKVPQELLKSIRAVCRSYGGVIGLCRTAGIHTQSLRRLRKYKTATPSMLEKINGALELINAEAEAA